VCNIIIVISQCIVSLAMVNERFFFSCEIIYIRRVCGFRAAPSDVLDERHIIACKKLCRIGWGRIKGRAVMPESRIFTQMRSTQEML
jgi:hypothetical protein